ncbi:ATP-binding cassette domain-containing protein [Acidovorax sp. M2(2025)]|uniref:phosphatase domain-containing putative toxin n=1 Tax=Acidovorax sp. M2(2025) TaxID=3411355 RepID=UPI003BF51760
MNSTHCLEAAGFGVAFGAKVVLADIELVLPRGSITALLGPSGAGKSTLLQTLAGRYAHHPRHAQRGTVLYDGRPLAPDHRPRLVQQNAQLMAAPVLHALADPVRERLGRSPAEVRAWCGALVRRMGVPELEGALDQPTLELSPMLQRAVAILREAVNEPALLMVDEPTADLSDYEAYVLLELLREVGRTSTLLVVLHNQRHASRLADRMALLAGGRVQEAREMENFLAAPASEAGQQFVRTGSCAVPAPDADPAMLADGVVPPPPLGPWPGIADSAAAQPPVSGRTEAARSAGAASAAGAPHGFAWLEPGRLAGTPMPGVVNEIDLDLAALRRMGITRLITLTERDLPQAALQRHGLTNLHLPIRDHEAPSTGQIQMLLKRMETFLAQGEVLAVHCLAGRGRTGTVLAAWWIREGLTAQEALRRLRLRDARYVQSAEQEAFLQRYEDLILQKIV